MKSKQNPMEHRRSTSQDRPIGAGWEDIKRGAQNWAPDIAQFIGSIPDAATYAARRIANGQVEQSVPSLGWGPAMARAVHELQQQLGIEDKRALPQGQSVGPVYEPSTREQAAQFANPLQFVNPASVARGAGLGSAEVIARAMQSEGPLAQMLTAGIRPMGVIKQKGGNWLSGSVEDALRGLKKGPRQGSLAGNFSDYRPLLEGEFKGEPRSSFYDPNSGELLDANIYHDYAAALAPHAPVNSWIDKALTKYVKNQMATPEDPIRALAEQGVLHVPAEGINANVANYGKFGARTGQTFPARSEAARAWDMGADNAIGTPTARGYMYGDLAKGDEWLRTTAPDTIVHTAEGALSPRDFPRDLGFDHLIDELSNSINPESGLPRHLLFPADRLDKVSVPQAVQRVSDINKWRAEQKVLADQARANNAATVLHKEYPEKGMKWVQLKGGKDDPLPEGWTTRDAAIDDRTTLRQFLDPEGKVAKDHPSIAALQDALKYEGDTMGHCVGGYCDDVASGRSNIYSLRDAKGQPHVTIETAPATSDNEKGWERATRELVGQYGDDGYDMLAPGVPEYDALMQKYEAENAAKAPTIVQIKGKGNAKPPDDYLPYVQDFVKSGQWSDVGDLQNSGLVHRSKLAPDEARLAPPDQQYFSDEDMKNIYAPVQSRIDAGEFAQGGSVAPPKEIKTVADLRAIIASLS